MQLSTGRTLIAGVGNIFLGDDGFGPEVVRHLTSTIEPAPGGARVVDYGIRGVHLAYDLLDGVDTLILVDAVPSGGNDPPGSIRTLGISEADVGEGADAGLDAHGLDPLAVLRQLRSLGGSLPQTFVVGCVPADMSEGIGLSRPVQASIPTAIAAIRAVIAGRLYANAEGGS